MNRRKFFGSLTGAILGSAALGSIPSSSGPLGGKRFNNETAAERRKSRFLNVFLRTHEGKEVRFYDDLIQGKTVLINFMVTACGDGICPLMTANLAAVQNLLGERMGRDIFIYSITLDPEHDTPEVLKGYAQNFGAKPGWLFLTGKKEEIERLRRNLGFVDSDPLLNKEKSSHIGVIKFGIEPLERWGACPALTKPKWIAQYISWIEPKGARPNGRPKKGPEVSKG